MRKFVSILLCFVLLAGFMLPASAQTVEADVHIRSVEDFLSFAESCRLDSYSREMTVSLEADIDLNGVAFEGIPVFCGTFLGNGHKIVNVDVSVNGSQRGLFRYVTAEAMVKDLVVSGRIAPRGSRLEVGGIVGNNAGTVENCVYEGEISGGDRVGGIAGINAVGGVIEKCAVKGSVYGKHFVGGIVGENAGVIRDCENMAAVNTTEHQNSIDLSDITIGTITGTESAASVTDIGGVAGMSSGTVKDCVNRGNVGYKHMGYNVGGIVGSQTGYVANCQNYGAVSGRKEVGGIVGQMEPTILLQYETDTLQMLKAQLAILGDITDRAALNAQKNTAAIQALIAQLEVHTANAEAALDVLLLDPENPELQEPDVYIAAVQTLSGSIAGIEKTLRKLYQAIKVTGDDLSRDLQDIANQVDVIDGILTNAEDHLGGTVTDVSDRDTPEDLTGKLEQVVNYGAVMGDLNVGGIAGAISLENDLDPEEDVSVSGEVTLNAAGKLRSVILGGVNKGSVSAKRRNAGGIVGWQSLGLLKLCQNTGAVSGGQYTGGIAGQSMGYIRTCAVKAVVTGTVQVGGVAGSGTVVTDCRTMVKLSGEEYMGAVLGRAEANHTGDTKPVSGNIYVCVDGDPGAIDGISYDTQAQSMTLPEFLAQADLQEMFRTVCVTFLFEDGKTESLSVVPGGALDLEAVPEVPEKKGYVGQWDGLKEEQLESILFDLTFQTRYIRHNSTVQSVQLRGGKPLMLVQGDFVPNAAVALSKAETLPPLSEGQRLLESSLFTVEGCVHTTALRYLIPENADPAKLVVYVRNEAGAWKQTEFRVDGSYLVIPILCGDDGVALVQEKPTQLPWMLIAVGGTVILLGVVIAVWVSHRRKKAKQFVQAMENLAEQK